jgi:hypothetical protein
MNQIFIANPEASADVHDGGIVILHVSQCRLYRSNPAGARIWRGIERRQPLEAIAEEISGEYQIAPAVAREHTMSFLAELERHALIRRGRA